MPASHPFLSSPTPRSASTGRAGPRRILHRWLPAALLFALGCDGGPLADSPTPVPTASMSRAAVTSPGTSWDDVVFLPPLGPDVVMPAATDLAPRLVVCRPEGDGCGSWSIEFAEEGGGDAPLRLEDGTYHAVWNTSRFSAGPGPYRLSVRVLERTLASMDLELTDSGGPLRHGRTLPIRFRVAADRFAVIGADGGDAVLADGKLRLQVPPGALDGSELLWAEAAETDPEEGIVPGTAWTLSPSGLAFHEPATAFIRVDPATLDPATDPVRDLVVVGLEEDGWLERPSSSSPDGSTMSGPLLGFSTKAVAYRVERLDVRPTRLVLEGNDEVSLVRVARSAARIVRRRALRTRIRPDGPVIELENETRVRAIGPGRTRVDFAVAWPERYGGVAGCPPIAGCVPPRAFLDVEVLPASLSPAEVALDIGEAASLTFSLAGPVTWSSSAAEVAAVDEDGVVRALGAGQAVITARQGLFDASATVTVRDPSPAERVWTRYDVGPEILRTVAESGDGTVWAVGDQGAAYRWTGQDWIRDGLPGDAYAKAALTLPDGRVRVAGDVSSTAALFVRDGGNWLRTVSDFPIPSGQTSTTIRAMVRPPDAAASFLVGNGNDARALAWHPDAQGRWLPSLPAGEEPTTGLNGVWGASRSEVWAVGTTGTPTSVTGGRIWRFDGASWSAHQDVPEWLTAVWGSGDSRIFAVGADGAFYGYDGAGWSRGEVPGRAFLTAVHGSDGEEVWVAGTGGTLARWDGERWTPASVMTEVTFRGVRVLSDGTVVAVGDGGEVWRGVVSR
ncbi:MAG: Ig-like domain-containing protein [Longimicrobiales bacterium]